MINRARIQRRLRAPLQELLSSTVLIGLLPLTLHLVKAKVAIVMKCFFLSL